MERTAVSSSTIQSVGYEADSQTLEVEFNTGAIYQYYGVPQEEYEALMAAPSKGTYFGSAIRKVYSYTRL